MTFFKNPLWIRQFEFNYANLEEVPEEVFQQVNTDLSKLSCTNPLVSIVIIAWNEEINILRCVASLAKTATELPIEIIVVNNNSTDRTQETLNKLQVKHFLETKQGAGPARQKGQENALGKYILTADADCLYPDCWVDEMMKVLRKDGVVCVYGRYSFISQPGFPRWELFLLERSKDLIAEIRHFKQPYYNTFGISMGYIKEYGLKIGFITINRRGEDGQLCLELMRYGKIKQVRSNKARAWTSTRTLEKDGSLKRALFLRIKQELKYFFKNFTAKPQ